LTLINIVYFNWST